MKQVIANWQTTLVGLIMIGIGSYLVEQNKVPIPICVSILSAGVGFIASKDGKNA